MSFGAYARFARCRVPHLSPWARNVNVRIQMGGMHRGLASTSLMRLAAEPRPINGFVEQRSSVPSGIGRLCVGEDADIGDNSDAQVLAFIISSITELDTNVANSHVEMLDRSVSLCKTYNW
mmetsp:Transcript_22478/g.57289  ORF Transcript_22478/g.57289 Transcript_22478/m.57289 type:complete len:121 (+) Transcript_22478:123-485(+)